MPKNNSNTKKSSSKMSKAGMAAAAAGAAAVGAGAYYFLGPNAKAHQKKAQALVTKMKKEIDRQMKKAEDLSTPIYHKVVDAVAENYAKQYKMHENDIRYIADKIKKEWLGKKKSPARKSAKRSAKKTTAKRSSAKKAQHSTPAQNS